MAAAQGRLGVARSPHIEPIVDAGHEPGDHGGRVAGTNQPGHGPGRLLPAGGQFLGAGRPVAPAPDEQGEVSRPPMWVAWAKGWICSWS
jgi:hypothetical protein